MKPVLFLHIFILFSLNALTQTGKQQDYLGDIRQEMQKKWPHNKTINLVFHGHSVPSGYFNTPYVRTMLAYPQQVLEAVKEIYPYAVVNSITTAIGGENAEQGAKRFEQDVLCHNPDVLFIDYALNDRGIGLKRSRQAWGEMIKEAQRQGIKVILMTPTPDLTENMLDDNSPLEQYSKQIRDLSVKYGTGLVDSYAAFKQKKKDGRDLNAFMSQSNHPNEKGHEVVKELILDYFFDKNQWKEYNRNSTLKTIRKVADWQLMHFESQVQKGSRWPNSHAYWAWTNATLYIGMAECAGLTGEQRYWDFLLTVAKKNGWKTGPNPYFADDLCIVQPYAMLYNQFREPYMIGESIGILDSIISKPRKVSLRYDAEGSHSRWCWADALFMAPTSFARIGKITGEKVYYDFMDQEFRVTYDTLYSRTDSLFYRDTRYKQMKEENGEKVFWGRGNGWVAGGLAIIIDHLPENYPSRNFYTTLFKEMMGKIARLQDERGFWHPSLLDPEAYSMPESSASAFFTYTLFWGINRGYLNREKYLPIALKAWNAIHSVVHVDGKIGFVQAIGADPKKVDFNDTEVYGTGAFLLAAVEYMNYLKSE
ncbi:MAG: glycoside hydrolase family 88 protein [Proteiniphilum sp.]|nr:glycoside hydrolase family 88 protein [Proteiniphilum sp.]